MPEVSIIIHIIATELLIELHHTSRKFLIQLNIRNLGYGVEFMIKIERWELTHFLSTKKLQEKISGTGNVATINKDFK